MDERIEELEALLRFEVTDAARAQGTYVWTGSGMPGAGEQPDAEVVAFLVNYYRTASSTMDDLQAAARQLDAELQATRARLAEAEAELAHRPGPPIDVVEVVPDPTDQLAHPHGHA